MKYLVECSKIRKFFGEAENRLEVLKSVDLKVQEGEFLMLVGPSGCGKTTLISIIAGILPFDGGGCIIDGNDLSNMREKDLLNFRAKNVGFVFQSFNLIPTISVAENVSIPLIISGMDNESAAIKANQILKAVGLEGKEDMLPGLLSGGQQQRVAIARALIHNPKLLICDEPTSALDFHTGENIVSLLRQINRELGSTFIVVTHDNRILKYADRIVYLDDGEIEKEHIGGKNAKKTR